MLALSHGGQYLLDNIVQACRSCNASKCNDEVTGWLRRKRLDERTFLLRHLEVCTGVAAAGVMASACSDPAAGEADELPGREPTRAVENGSAMWASSSIVPSRPIGTMASTLARPSGSSARLARGTREVHEVRADRIDLHVASDDLLGDVAHEHVGGCPGRRVQRGPGVGRAPAALVNTKTWPPPRSTIAGTTPRRNW